MGFDLSLVPTWVAAVPNVIWSGLLASAVTLAGVLIADWRNTVRQRRQHCFDEEQARIDRTMDIRREVYLPVSGALSRLQAHMFSLADAKTEASPANPMVEFADACAKLAMVSTTRTAMLVQKMLSEYAGAYMQLVSATTVINAARSDAEIHGKLKDDAQKDFDRVSLEIKRFLETASRDQMVFEAMRRSQQYAMDQRNHHANLENDAMTKVAVEYRKFARRAIEHLAPIGEASIPVLISIRAELGHETDAEELAQAMRGNRDKELARLREFLDGLEVKA